MTKTILPIFLIVAGAGLFFGYISPTYTKISTVKAEASNYDQALQKSKELLSARDILVTKYNENFSAEDLLRLERLVPDTVDNVRLVLDIDNIAARYGMVIKNVRVNTETEDKKNLGPDDEIFGSIMLTFSVNTSYPNFVQFIRDLENSLRLVDVVGISFKSTESSVNDYEVTIQTYWLK